MSDFNASAEMSLLRQGINQRWPIPLQAKQKALARIVGILDDKQATHKEVNDAAKTLAIIDKINLQQEIATSPKVSMNMSNMSTQELINKLQGVLANDPILRERLMNEQKDFGQNQLPVSE